MSKKKIDVVSSWILDENLNGISDGFFDNVIKHTDFPLEDVEDNNLTEDWDASFQLLELPSSDVLEGFPSSFCGKICNDILTPPRSPPKNEDKPKVKASPTQSSINATSNRSTPHCQTSRSKDSSLCHTSASVSILDSSSSGSIENSLPFSAKIFIPVKRARSKRVHRPMLYPRVNMPFAFSTSRASDKHRSAATSKRLSESDPSKKINYGKRKENNRHWLPGVKEVTSPSPSSFPARKCMHCEVTKTPQWREGPMGPKTLCNACGVRYRSGRLFPEYRPAASPTFVASLHSNSHRKVIEMRKKANHESRFVEVGNLRRPQVRISDGCVPASI